VYVGTWLTFSAHSPCRPGHRCSILDAWLATEFTEGWADSLQPAIRQAVEDAAALTFTADAPPLVHPDDDVRAGAPPDDGSMGLGPTPS
jgi:hypothetical protein